MFGMAMVFTEVAAVWSWSLPVGFLFLGLYFFGAYRFVDQYYEQRFGWVEPSSISNRGFVTLMGTLIALFFFAPTVEPALSRFAAYLDVMLSGSARSSYWHPTVFWTMLLFVQLFSQDREWKKTTFLAGGTTVVMLLGTLPLWLPEWTQSLAFKVFQAGWLGLSVMALGFYNHIRLLLLLPRKVEDPAQ